MALFTRNTHGLDISEDEKYRRNFVYQSLGIMACGIFGGPFIVYYFMFYESAGPVFYNLKTMNLARFFIFWLAIILAASTIVLLSLGTYYREKDSRRGREHGSSKFMTRADMSAFRRGFFFDPKIVKSCKGFEKEGSSTFFDNKELKQMMKSSKKCEKELRKHPLKPIKTKSERKLYKRSPVYKCFMESQILAQDVYMSMNCKFISRNLNTITIGGSGQGKSFSELFPNIMQANANYVITDPSGEILQKCGKFLIKKGYALKVFNVKDFNQSMRYNPFAYIEDEKDINVLVDSINKNIGGAEKVKGGPNQFFDDAQMALTAALISALREIYPNNPEKQTLFNLMELLRLAKKIKDPKTGVQYSELDNVFDELKAKNPRSYAVKMYEDFKVADEKLNGSVIISATAVFGRYFDSDDMAKLVEADDLNLYDFVTGVDEKGKPLKCALFLIIPQDTSTYNFMVSMVYSQLFSIVTKGGERWRLQHNTENPALPRHLSFWLDEFANIGRIPSFNEVLSVVRKYNISVNIIIQSAPQLKAGYKDSWEVILGNCDSAIFLGGQDPTTVKLFMEKLGKETIKTHSSSQSGRKSSTQSQQYTGRELLNEAEIAQMPRAMELLFITGCKPFIVRKYNLTKHPNYLMFGEADPKNNLNITDFNYLAKDGKSKEEYRTINMWCDTGKRDDCGVYIMKLTKVCEPLLDNEDRLIRIDNNTISKEGILKDIENLTDRTYNAEKKIRMLKDLWMKAESKKTQLDMTLSKIQILAAKGEYPAHPEEIKGLQDEFQEASEIASRKHLQYLFAKKSELEGLIRRKDKNSDDYVELSNRLTEINADIDFENNNIKNREKGIKDMPKTKVQVSKEELIKNSLEPDEKLNKKGIDAAEKVANAEVKEVTKENLEQVLTTNTKVIRLDGFGLNIISEQKYAPEPCT